MVHVLASEERENEKNLPYPRLSLLTSLNVVEY